MSEPRPYYLEERQEEILDLLNANSTVRIVDLSERFGVSEATIRKDMRALEGRGLLRRTHGGAILPNPNSRELSFEDASSTAQDEKRRIGYAAAKMVRDGDTFFLQSGTTTGCMLRALKGRKNLTVLTNDLSHAILAEELLVDSEVILLGGQLRFGYHYTQGNETIRLLNEYFFHGNQYLLVFKRIYGASIGAGEHGERHRERCRPTHNPHGLIENRRHRLGSRP